MQLNTFSKFHIIELQHVQQMFNIFFIYKKKKVAFKKVCIGKKACYVSRMYFADKIH